MEETVEHGLGSRGLDDEDGNQFLTFVLNDEEYGVDILKVQEIKGWEEATEVPNTSDYVKGVINMRGTIIPIIDLRTRFSLETKPPDRTTVVIILKVQTTDRERTVGLVVDAVAEVYNVNADAVQPSPDFNGSIRSEYLMGLATIQEKMLILLDVDRLVTDAIEEDGAREAA